MQIDIKTVERVATLSKLHLTDEEKQQLAKDMTRIVSYFEKMDQLDTSGVEPLIYLTEDCDGFRDDVPEQPLSQQEALMNGPQKDSDYFKVPKFLERE